MTGEPRWGVVPVTIDELGFVPLSRTTTELPFGFFSQRYERGSIMVTTNLPFDEWTEVFGSERLTGALLYRLTHHVHILEMNGESYRLKCSRENAQPPAPGRSRRRINRTLDAFSSCSCNVAPLPDLLPSVTSQRVHFCSALLAPHPGALDTSARIRGLSARGRAFSALGGQEAKRS